MNKIEQICMATAATIILAGCQTQLVQDTPDYVTQSCDGVPVPSCGGGSTDANVTITFIGDKPDSVDPDPVEPCKNGKITFQSNDNKQYAVIFSPGAGNKVKLKQNVWSNSTGELEVNMKAEGCTTYTVMRKTGTKAETLDPMVIIKQ